MKNMKVYPSALSGCAQVPPSKSIAHRLLICAALAKGTSYIDNIDYSADIKATIGALRQLGAEISEEGRKVVVKGTGGKINAPKTPVNCNESGSTLRFFIPIFSLCGQRVVFTGAKSLFARPLTAYERIFKQQNNIFNLNENSLEINGALTGGSFSLAGNVSSQFISGLLFALPLMGGGKINIEGNFESKSYVDLTISAMEKFGISGIKAENSGITMKNGQGYLSSAQTVEGDWSQAAALLAFGAIQDGISVRGLEKNSLQGDKAILDIIARCGVSFSWQNGVLQLEAADELKAPEEISLDNCPDLGPVLCALLHFCKGKSRIVNAGRLRIKESDRIACVENELKKFDCKISSGSDYIEIIGAGKRKNLAQMNKNNVNAQKNADSDLVQASSHNDHRIVMALSIMGLCGAKGAFIDNAAAISKSWPAFFNDVAELGARLEEA